MVLKLKNISDLKPSDYNPRKITDKALSGLERSIEEFGDISGIVFNSKNGHLLAGHARCKALKEQYGDLEIKNNEIVLPDGKTFPIRVVNWPKKKELAANVAANASTISGEFTDELVDILDEIKNDDLELFEDLNFEELLDDLPGIEECESEGETDADDVPEVDKSIIQKGDLVFLGDHRLLCGDSIVITDVDRLMGGETVECIFTDPPYGINIVSKDGSVGGGTKGKYKQIIGDNDKTVAVDAYNLCCSLGVEQMFFWGANHYSSHLPDSSCWVVWDKQGGKSVTFADCELCYTNLDKPVRMFTHIWDGFRRDSEKGETRIHPTQKPVQLFIDIWEKFESPNKVLDLFLGSGSTLIACEKTKRVCYGMELDEHYCTVIVKRFIDFVGSDKDVFVERDGKKIPWKTLSV